MTDPFPHHSTKPTTLVDILRQRAAHQADSKAYTFLVDGELEEEQLTYAELDIQARAIAALLQQRCHVGERALLLYPSGLEYIAAFLGCLYAGVVAVPAYPPRRNRSLSRINAIVTDAQATVALTTVQIKTYIERRFADEPALQSIHWLSTDHIQTDHAENWKPVSLKNDSLAFLQYTSGSTGSPKGVMINHGNLMYNERMIQESIRHTENAIVVGWLPLYHDMGLIGNVLQPLFIGAPCAFMAPVSFLQKPVRWLRAITRFKGTTSVAPNFAYDLCVRKVTAEQRETLDLSRWDVAFNGSEPIRYETLERFTHAFGPCGFKIETFYPTYGLAEATLFVTGGSKSEKPVVSRVDSSALEQNRVVYLNGEDVNSRTLVSCGWSWMDLSIDIVNPDSFESCPPGQIGEIWVSGPSVAKGYWNRPEETQHTFQAVNNGSPHSTALRTGDLGFKHNDHLYVTGRIKDLIIIRGRNYYPHDIEKTVESSHPALRPGFGAAFSISVNGEEKLAIAQEVLRTYLRDLKVDSIVEKIRQAVSEEYDLQVHTVVLLKMGSIPKTTSGKIQRHACHAGLLAGTLNIVGSSILETVEDEAPAADDLDRETLLALPVEERRPLIAFRLQQLVARAMKVSTAAVDRNKPLTALGLDSLDVVDLKVSIESSLGVSVPADEGLQDLSISQLASGISNQLDPNSRTKSTDDIAVEQAEPDVFAKCDTDGGYFGAYRVKKDRYFTQPILEGIPGPRMQFEGKDMIVWSINNYLGLIGDERIRTGARKILDLDGTWSPMGSRMLTGNSWQHIDLEQRLAAYLKKESSIVFNYGYMGVMGTIAALTGNSDTVLIDSLSHACIVDGAMVASAGRPFRVFRHNDMNSLEDQLKSIDQNRRGGILIVTEGVYGMSGDLAPLPEICRLKEKYGARLFVDDAHGFGVMGETGAGTGEHFDIQDRIDLYFGTFAKSFVAIGGVTVGDEKVVEYIRYNARTNIFAKSLPLVYVETVGIALDIMRAEPEHREKLWYVARKLQEGLKGLGFDIGNTESPITPVYVPTGDEKTATTAMRMLRDDFGVFVSAVTYPVVPRGVVLFRLTSSAAHTDEDIELTLEAFKQLRDRLDLRVAPTNGQTTQKRKEDLIEPTVS